MFHKSHSLIESLELNTLNEHFLFGKTIFDKVLKLTEGAIKPLQGKKILEI